MVFSESWRHGFRRRDVSMVYKWGCYHCCPMNCKVTSTLNLLKVKHVFLYINIQSQFTKVNECKNVFGSLDVHTKQIKWTTWEGRDYNGWWFRIICNSENPNAQYWEIKENQCFANIQGWLPHAHKVCEVVEEKYQWVEACIEQVWGLV